MGRLIPREWQDLNATQRDILVTLAAYGPASGKTIHERRGQPHGTRKTTHTNLVTLRELGYVNAELIDGERGGKKRNELTDKGRTLVRQAVVETSYSLDV